jgi:hypothetical protein
MANKTRVTVKVPKIVIKEPGRRFFTDLGLSTAKRIRVRTESEGVDVNLRPFKPYSPKYREQRQEKGRRTTPNLSFTSRMLSALGPGVRATLKGFKIIISGEQGFKAWVNEINGRDFFGLDKKLKDDIFKKTTDFITKANRLKKR